MITLTISVNDFNDAITMEEWDVINVTFEFFKDHIEKGGRIIFEIKDQPVLIVSNKEEFKDWKSKVEEVIAKIKQIKNSD